MIRTYEKCSIAGAILAGGDARRIGGIAKGTFEVAKKLANRTENGAISIVGGGDSVAAINKSGLEHKITHISTGGGASLELLSGYELPGLVSLTDKGN